MSTLHVFIGKLIKIMKIDFFVHVDSYLHDTKTQTNNFKIFICLSICLFGLVSGSDEPIFMRLTLKDRKEESCGTI